jgi:hypothetical protein
MLGASQQLPACDCESRGLAPHRNDFEISMLPHVKEREPDGIAKPSAPLRAIASMRSRALARSATGASISAALFDSPSTAMLIDLSLQLLRDDNAARQPRNRYF